MKSSIDLTIDSSLETTKLLLLLSDKLDNDNNDKFELNDNSLILFSFFYFYFPIFIGFVKKITFSYRS